MSVRADLHIHTTASDGTWTPAELIAEAQKQQLGLIAVTDHDSVANVAEAMTLATGSGHYVVAGSGNLLNKGGFIVSYSGLWH